VSEGSVHQCKDGRWCGTYRDVTGKWRYVYRRTKTEAKQALREALKDRDDGIVHANKMTIAVLLDQWLKEMASEVSTRTLENRESIIRLHVQPTIGSMKLAKVDHKDIRDLLRAKSEQLAPSTVKRIYAFLNQAFEFAVSRKHISRNPVPEVKPPKQWRRDIDVLKPEQVRHLLDSVKGTRYEPIIVLGATCGLRVGEALSLRWEDVDLDRGTVYVRRTL
jgi:integrase